MTKLLFTTGIIFLLSAKILFCQLNIELDGYWKFKIRNNPEWKNPDISESNWDNIVLHNDAWESLGYQYNGIAWYRKSFILPAKPGKATKNNEYIILDNLNIRDKGQVFLNGDTLEKFIVPHMPEIVYQSQPYSPKILIPYNSDIFLWDKTNVLAVQVHHPIRAFKTTGFIGGGIVNGHPVLRDATINDLIDISCSLPMKAATGKDIPVKMTFRNIAPANQRIQIRLNLIEASSGKVIQSKKREHTCTASGSSSFHEQFTIPATGDFYLGYDCNIIGKEEQLTRKQLIAYEPVADFEKQRIAGDSGKYATNVTLFKTNNQQIEGLLGKWLSKVSSLGIKQYISEFEHVFLKPYCEKNFRSVFPLEEGQFIGKLIEGASNMLKLTHDVNLKPNLDKYVAIWLSTQADNGYLGPGDKDKTWAIQDFYTQKYNMSGLLAYYEATGNLAAYNASKAIADLIMSRYSSSNIYKSQGYSFNAASMALVPHLLDIFKYSGEQKYLDYCEYIFKNDNKNGLKLIPTLLDVGQVNKLIYKKGRELLANFAGIAKYYSITGDEKYYQAAENAWNDIVEKRLYITGSATSAGYFTGDYSLPLDSTYWPNETCVTANWLMFNQEMFMATGNSKYVDQIEITIYNQLAGSFNPLNGGIAFFCPLRYRKPYQKALSCCNTNLQRAFSKVPELIWFKYKENGMGIQLYTESKLQGKIKTLNGEEINIECTIETDYPKTGNIIITLNPEKEAAFRLALRVPEWSRAFNVQATGVFFGSPGKFLYLDNNWFPGDKIIITVDMNDKLIKGGNIHPRHYAIMHGPQVLAIDATLNNIPGIEKIKIDPQKELNLVPAEDVFPDNWFGNQAYYVSSVKPLNDQDIILVPFSDAGQTNGDINVWIPSY